MRRAAMLLLLFSALPAYTPAQSSSDFRRYEVGAQFDVSYLSGVGDWGGGFGARFHYNFDEHIALDSELIFRQHDVASFNSTAAFTGTVGQTTGMFGVRAGQRFDSDGFFFSRSSRISSFRQRSGLDSSQPQYFSGVRRRRHARALFRTGDFASRIRRDGRPVWKRKGLFGCSGVGIAAATFPSWHASQSGSGFRLCRAILRLGPNLGY